MEQFLICFNARHRQLARGNKIFTVVGDVKSLQRGKVSDNMPIQVPTYKWLKNFVGSNKIEHNHPFSTLVVIPDLPTYQFDDTDGKISFLDEKLFDIDQLFTNAHNDKSSRNHILLNSTIDYSLLIKDLNLELDGLYSYTIHNKVVNKIQLPMVIKSLILHLSLDKFDHLPTVENLFLQLLLCQEKLTTDDKPTTEVSPLDTEINSSLDELVEMVNVKFKCNDCLKILHPKITYHLLKWQLEHMQSLTQSKLLFDNLLNRNYHPTSPLIDKYAKLLLNRNKPKLDVIANSKLDQHGTIRPRKLGIIDIYLSNFKIVIERYPTIELMKCLIQNSLIDTEFKLLLDIILKQQDKITWLDHLLPILFEKIDSVNAQMPFRVKNMILCDIWQTVKVNLVPSNIPDTILKHFIIQFARLENFSLIFHSLIEYPSLQNNRILIEQIYQILKDKHITKARNTKRLEHFKTIFYDRIMD